MLIRAGRFAKNRMAENADWKPSACHRSGIASVAVKRKSGITRVPLGLALQALIPFFSGPSLRRSAGNGLYGFSWRKALCLPVRQWGCAPPSAPLLLRNKP
jgi:hypothetical protein